MRNGRNRSSPDPALLDELRDLTSAEFREWVALAGLSDEDAEDILWWLAWGHRYFERPVDVETFLNSSAYMNARDENGDPVLWPEVVKAIKAICEGTYIEAVLTGSIGSAKTSVALYVTAYKLYDLLCMKNPHQVYGLDPSTEILMVMQSLNKQLAQDVDYTRLKAMVDRAPIFSDVNFKYDRSITSEMRFPKRIVVKPIVGEETGAIGQNVIGGIIDELNYGAIVEKSKRTRDKTAYNQAIEQYNSIARRRKSRFLDQGELPGMLCLVSSKKYPGEFTDGKLAEARDRPGEIYVYDKRVWDVKPWAYKGEWFQVFVGDLTRKPRILEEDEQEEKDLVIRVPVEHRVEFEKDILNALREVAGIGTLAIHPFFLDRETLAEVFGKVPAIMSRPDVDFQDTQLRIYPKRWRGTEKFPRLAHLDLSKSHDSAGLGIGHVRGFKRIQRAERVWEVLPIIVFDVLLEITPPRGGEINYQKIRSLLYKLHENGMPIRWVTADQFQSHDMLQILQGRGFQTGQESTDKTTMPYEVLKTAVYDQRVEAPLHPKALAELTTLERDPITGKIDHPEYAGASKDVADCMACVVIGLSLMGEVWHQFSIPVTDLPPQLARAADRERKDDLEDQM